MQRSTRKVLLLSPVSRTINHYRPPLALMYLSGYLKRHGVEAELVDIPLREQIRDRTFYKNISRRLREIEDEVRRRVEVSAPDIVGIGCYTPELQEVEQLAAKVKAVAKDAKIVVGGIHPTLYPEHFLDEDSPFDFTIVGEGEQTLLELAQAIRSGADDFTHVKGIGYFDKRNRKKIITGPRPVLENLDDLAPPDYDDLDMAYYTTASPYAIRGVFTRSFYLSSSRGCPSSCTFCVSKKLRDYQGARNFTRLRSPSSLFEEISFLRAKHGIDSFYFIDDLFTLKKSNVIAFCNVLKNSRLPLIWGCSSKVNTVDEEMLTSMRDAGCVQIDFGVEKGSDEALARIKKGITTAQIRRTFETCRRLKIRTFANILVNTPDEEIKDLEDIERLLTEIRANIVSINIFIPYPGCEIYDTHCNSFTKQDYSLLMPKPGEMTSPLPAKLRFARHDVDLAQWGGWGMKKFNRILPNLAILSDPRYLRSLVHSSRKTGYFKQLFCLLREFANQKL